MASANRLHCHEIPELLEYSSHEDRETIQEMLERDYRVVNSLLRRAGGLELGESSLEEILLRIDFQIMRALHGLCQSFSAAGSRYALGEMGLIVAHFASAYGATLGHRH